MLNFQVQFNNKTKCGSFTETNTLGQTNKDIY